MDGYDACVADKGAAVFCLVSEHYPGKGYEAGSSYTKGKDGYQYKPYQEEDPAEYGGGYDYGGPYKRYENEYHAKEIT